MGWTMDRKRLAKMFYEQAKLFAEIHDLTYDEIAAAQFHASVKLAVESDCSKAAAEWIESRKTEYRTTMQEFPDWFRQQLSAK